MEKWKCTICGYVHEGPMTDDFKGSVSKHSQAFFEVRAENY